MDLVAALRTLWRRKLLLVLAAIVAVGIAVQATYEIQLSPLTLEGRGFEYGAAETSLLVDLTTSILPDATSSLTPVAQRVQIVAASLDGAEVRAAIARRIRQPVSAVDVSTQLPGDVSSVPGTQRAAELASVGADYRVFVAVFQGSPILTVATEAPNAAEAIRLADAVALAGRDFVSRLSAPGSGVRLVLRQLDASSGGTVNPGSNLQIAIVIGVGSFVAVSLLLLLAARAGSDLRTYRRLDAARRSAVPERHG